jgi:hypothetical protein
LEWLIEQFNILNFEASLHIAGKGEKTYENHLKELDGDPQNKNDTGHRLKTRRRWCKSE